MKVILITTVAALMLSGCVSQKLTPEQLTGMANAFAQAGCKGNVTMSAGGSTASGASIGSAHAEFTASGDCDPSRVTTNPVQTQKVVDKGPAS